MDIQPLPQTNQSMTDHRLQDLHTVQPNMLDMAPSMMTRNANNNAPELATWKKPTAKPITHTNLPDVNAIIR